MSATFSNLTPFAAAKVTNKVLAAKVDGDFTEVRPQMMYNYAKKGIIESNYDSRMDGEKVYFEGTAFKAWLDKYVQKVISGESTSRVDYDTLADQYM